MRVLIVDDSSTARRFLKKALPAPFLADVVEADGARQGLEICGEGGIDLVFLDLTMPEMDGYEVLAALGGRLATLPVIVVSGDVQTQAPERAKALGARAFIKKPASKEQVEAVLREIGVL
jgi:CheY-like chemotaxis protein